MAAASEIHHSIEVQGAEEWVVAVNEVIRAYRGTSPNATRRQLGLRDAVTRLQGLGLSEGDAIRWLEPRQKSAVHRKLGRDRQPAGGVAAHRIPPDFDKRFAEPFDRDGVELVLSNGAADQRRSSIRGFRGRGAGLKWFGSPAQTKK